MTLPTDLQAWLVPILIFAAAAAGIFGLGQLILGNDSVRDRLRRLNRSTPAHARGASSGWRLAVAKYAAPVAKLAASDQSGEQVSAQRARFMRAGLHGASTPMFFFAAKTMLAIVLPLLALLALRLQHVQLETINLWIVILASATLGLYIPNMLLALRTRHRQREIFEAFPDAVDLMVVCVEAGIGLDAAIGRTAAEMEIRSQVMAEELQLVAAEMRVGASREQALRNLATRTGIEEVSSFVAMLIQADRFGTSIADSLRVQSDTLRVKRRQRAEEQAAKLPTKLLFPLIFCIFPSLLLVLLGPSMVQVYRVLFPTMNGG